MRRTAVFALGALTMVLGACVDDAVAPDGMDDHGIAFAIVQPQRVSQTETNALASAFDQVDQYSIAIMDAQTLAPIVDTLVSITPGGAQHALDIDVPPSAFGTTVTIDLIAYGNGVELYRSTLTLVLSSQVQQLPVSLEIRYTGPGVRGRVVDPAGVGVSGVVVDLMQGNTQVATETTEPDGTFLFTGMPTGATYSVEPAAPAGAFMCPGTRDVTISTGNEAIVADFLVNAAACSNDVLVLSGGDFDDTGVVASMLSADPNLTVSTFFYVNQMPSDSLLDAHDVVLLFSNGLFDESTTMGNRLSGYVSRGGNVVTASFYWQDRSDSGIAGATGWGALEQVDPMSSNGGANYTVGTLNTTVPHPLTTGVTVLVTNSFWGGAAAQATASVVATWSDGSPLVAYRTLAGGQRLVGVSLFPAVGAQATGDVAQLFQNAVTWAGSAGGPVPN